MHVIGQRETRKLQRFLHILFTNAQNIAQKWKRRYISLGEKSKVQELSPIGVSEIVGCASRIRSPGLETPERRE
jgi:hypothetical protein